MLIHDITQLIESLKYISENFHEPEAQVLLDSEATTDNINKIIIFLRKFK